MADNRKHNTQAGFSFPATPCAGCRFFRLVPLPSGRSRAVCAFTGEKLARQGAPLCDFRQAQEGDDAA